MMDLRQIEQESRAAAKRAARQKREPLMVEKEDLELGVKGISGIPFIGDYIPKGWRKVDIIDEWYGGDEEMRGVYHAGFFVDASGFGASYEPALTIDQFIEKMRPGYGYAVIEAGQFQVHVGVFERVQ